MLDSCPHCLGDMFLNREEAEWVCLQCSHKLPAEVSFGSPPSSRSRMSLALARDEAFDDAVNRDLQLAEDDGHALRYRPLKSKDQVREVILVSARRSRAAKR